MAVNTGVAQYGLRGLKYFSVLDVDINHVDPNDPNTVSAQALGVFIAGSSATAANPSVPNGADIAEGATTDAAYTDATGASAGSVISLLKGWFRAAFIQSTFRQAASVAAGNVVKATAGTLRSFWGQNGAAISYLQVYAKNTAPVFGTDVPILTYPIAANALFNQSLPGHGLPIATGITIGFTTDPAGTTAAAAGAVTAFQMFYN